MPVALQIYRNNASNAVRAVMENMSDVTIRVDISILTPSTQDTRQRSYALPPRATEMFGTDQGVALYAGDQVTIESPPYPPQTKLVR